MTPTPLPFSIAEPSGPRLRVLWLSTFAFTVMFAIWLMLGVLGLKIKTDPALMLGEAATSMTAEEIKVACESRFEWLLATAILAGSLLPDPSQNRYSAIRENRGCRGRGRSYRA